MKRKAFTLIELLVVVAIIALLMAVLVPALKRAKNQAAAATCLSNMKSMSACWHTYSLENHELMVNGHVPRGIAASPRHWVEAPQVQVGTTYTYTGEKPLNSTKLPREEEILGIRRGLLYPYVDSPDAYHCPADRSSVMFGDKPTAPYGAWWNSYSITGLMNGERSRETASFYGGTPDPKSAVKTSEVISPGNKVVFLENGDYRGWLMGSWLMNYTTPQWNDPFAIWHGGRSTLGFVDGHAEMHTWEDWSTNENAKFRGTTHAQYPSPLSGEKGDDIRYMQQAYVPGRR